VNLGDLGALIGQFSQSGDPEHFDRAAQAAPRDALAGGLADAFRANDTPAFPQMLTQLFQQSNGEQRAGILNQIISVLGPALAGQAAGGALSGILSRGGQVTPQDAERVPAEEVERVAAKAEQKNPSIVDQVSEFYSEHPGIVKTLGGAALAIVMARIAQKHA
jgi:hypothetical protein